MKKPDETSSPHRSIGLRLGLIALAAAAVVAFAAYQTDALSFVPGLSRSVLAPRSARLNVPVPAGSKLLRSYKAVFNGRGSKFAHYASSLPPEQVIEYYKTRASTRGRTPLCDLPGIFSVKEGKAMVSYRDTNGSTVGVVAFENDRGGSVYFVGRSMPAEEPRRGRDVPGREPPDVPKPLRSVRVMCLENLAGLPSILSMYEGWGAIDDSVEITRDEMQDAGWQCNEHVEEALSDNINGRVLSYTRGTQNCLIHFERETRTNHVAVTMFYCEKSWLPPGRGF